MRPINKLTILTLILLCKVTLFAYGQVVYTDSAIRLHTDFPNLNKDNKLYQDIIYANSNVPFTGDIFFSCYKYNSLNDSILLLRKKAYKVKFSKGIDKLHFTFVKLDTNTFYSQKFNDALVGAGQMPAGTYKFRISIKKDSILIATIEYTHNVDSNLGINSPLRTAVDKQLLPTTKKFLGINLSGTISQQINEKAGSAIKYASRKIDNVAKRRGLNTIIYQAGNKKIINFYYQDWFVGKYEVNKNESITKFIHKQTSQFDTNPGSFVNSDFDDASTYSQVKTLENKKKQPTTGELSLLTNVSTGQEPSSDMDNNYYEVRGQVETDVYGLPVEFDGYYTSQDGHRTAKASFLRMHYDVDEAKSRLMQSINEYKSKYGEVESKTLGMASVYQTYLNTLEGQRNQLLNEINSEKNTSILQTNDIGSNQNIKQDTTGINQTITTDIVNTGIGSKVSQEEQKLKSSEQEMSSKFQDKYNRLNALEQKIEKYQNLLSQCQNTHYFDSVYAYKKLENVDDGSSYKQMAKEASAILPDGKAKSFIAGITNFDIGSIDKVESKYTMDGQNLKGLDFGYDLGVCKEGITVGSTEYIGADGNVDKYLCYSAKTIFTPAKKEKIGLTYYGYMPSHSMISNEQFFKNVDIAEPGFKQPVHIISINYDGSISKYITINSEIASSYKAADHTNVKRGVETGDNMAYNMNLTANVPHTNVSIEGDYENTGKNFENNTLPINSAGTKQVRLAGTGDFFSSFLTLGIEYNYLLQSNLNYTGSNTRLGFSIATHSRRYPSLSFSYKPYTTFRSVSDTLAIAQHPLVGSVTIAKANYQIKKHDKSWIFILIYNNSSSMNDEIHYKSQLFQWSCIYNTRRWATSVNIGAMNFTGTGADSAIQMISPNKTDFLNASINYNLNSNLSINGGQEYGIADFGFCKYAVSGGITYQFKKIPIISRVNMRYYTYELNRYSNWQHLYNCSLEIIWQIKPPSFNNRYK